MARIKDVRFSTLNLPLRETFKTSLGEKSVTRNVGVTVDLGDIQGYGEASSSLAMPEATPASMMNVIGKAAGLLIGARLEDWKGIIHDILKRWPKSPTAVSALECALLDAFCRSKGQSIAKYFGGAKKEIETYYTIPALDPSFCTGLARGLSREGFRRFKVKITGKDFAEDLRRIENVFNAGPKHSIIVDANQGLDAKGALNLIDALQKASVTLDLLEQPLPKDDIKGHKFVKDRSPCLIGADESVRTFEDAEKFIAADAAQVINLKIAKTGLIEGQRIAKLVLASGRKLMIGCMMESAAGLSASVQWALGAGKFQFHDLDSFLLLKEAGRSAGFTNRGPLLSLKPKTLGSGIDAL
ncbi:MAG: hypothetical protein A2901_00300 [Elusimicrobia bacterium RIFCSPLOWO2_01_FULL_54_10]|nr:MAG: hypothetical protein A2901_00300 [Elusimicrobia bacterium RIFCSPLOWO2_01_FULL_54_10]